MALPSGLSEQVGDDEDLARFLTQSSYFNSQMVRPAAFMPSPKSGETSVFRHGEEPRAALRELATPAVLGGRTLHGAAIVEARHVRAASLEVIPDEPPQRHANILRWPVLEPDPETAKAQQKERAAMIAANARLVRFS